ncbi:hypothetical protein J6590_099686 [Homalodisca vitripennis]|nr:hypothetical protein J6590_099686 [Homalodisca vitripennis]
MRLLPLLLLLSTLSCIQARVLFPEEVVSFLSFVYSVLPPVKIGKDSRFGVGFRVGPNADFQVLLELGPQSETQPLGPSGNSKRQTVDSGLANTNVKKPSQAKRLKKKKNTILIKTTNESIKDIKTNTSISVQ